MNLLLLILSSLATTLSAQLILKDLISQRYEVDQIMKIEWESHGTATTPASDSLLTIDLVNERPEVMLEAYLIASEVPVNKFNYTWTLPRFLKSSAEYHLRIYFKGRTPPVQGQPGYGKPFTLINPNPMRQSTLNLLEPTGSADGSNLESTCLLGEQCFIVWDYPDWAETAMPPKIDIKLYSGNRIILVLAQNIPVSTKSFLWQVPSTTPAGKEPVHVVISASGKELNNLTPGQSFYLASSGYPFILETRGERESRRKFNHRSDLKSELITPVDQINTTFDDVPRPTYGGSNKNKATNGNIKTSSNSDSSLTASSSLSLTISLISIVILAFSF